VEPRRREPFENRRRSRPQLSPPVRLPRSLATLLPVRRAGGGLRAESPCARCCGFGIDIVGRPGPALPRQANEQFGFEGRGEPMLILAASLAGRRWGPTVGGWLVGLPLTSAPVAFFLAIDQGLGFAKNAAAGSLAGTAAQAGFCLAYCATARYCRWPVALVAATAAFAAIGGLLAVGQLPLWVLMLLAPGALAAVLRFSPAVRQLGGPRRYCRAGTFRRAWPSPRRWCWC
jgi:hypothetical protein